MCGHRDVATSLREFFDTKSEQVHDDVAVGRGLAWTGDVAGAEEVQRKEQK